MSKQKAIVTVEPNKMDLYITREFDAPVELVFKAHTDPELFAQWIGPYGLVTKIENFEPVSGGRWGFTQTENDGSSYGFHGVFHEVSPTRIIQTFEFDGLPESGHVALETMTLVALPNNRTKITTHSVFQSVADRDGMVQSGMEGGVQEGYERLDEILANMK